MANPFEQDEMTGEPQAVAEDQKPPAESTTADPLAAMEEEKAALQDRLLRLAAEFENYRKRIDRERRDQADAAVANAIEDLLPIIDNFERALEASNPAKAGRHESGDIEAFRRGVELIHKQMLDLLRKRGVTPIEALGTDFDPNVHQAVIHEPSDQHREGEVMEELQRGYKLGERLLRPSMVKVAKRP
jgi:molecular chaperone GrpE